jgi:hypothetical protein
LTVGLHGLDSAAGISARPVGPGIRVGRPTVLPGGDVKVDTVMDLGASTDEGRWLVLLGDTGAAAGPAD